MLTFSHNLNRKLRGGGMARTLFSVASLVLLAGLIPAASAQEKNELTGLIGRTFVSDHASIDTSAPGALLTSASGLSVEANYGRRLMDLGIVGLTAEVPLVVNFGENVHYPVNLVPKDYKSFIVTPSLRANLFPDSGISPWVSAGGGFGYFKTNSTLEFGGTNPGDTGTTSAIFQIGVGLDVKLFSRLSLRGEARDFYSGVPPLNVDIGKSRQHNIFVGAGVVYHF
jgi:Outer membrane protein beta-barrel domain